MTTCRACGMIGTAGDEDPRRPRHFSMACHIDELCPRCNDLYNKHYRRLSGLRWWQENTICRHEQVLVEFLARRLELLAGRHRAGKPITRCQAQRGLYDRCYFWYSTEIDGHKVCSTHAEVIRRGQKIRFVDDDPKWLDDVAAFFYGAKV